MGDLTDSVTVQAASPQLHYDSASVGGLITRDQIQGVPLNGRSFLELAKLEPGVQPPTGANRDRTVVPILSAPAPNVGGARFTVDGGSVTSVGLGGAQMGFSQELVQEFQVSTVNFDLSAGMTDAGAINVVTRAGGNEFQATTFYFFRDHNLAAYPALNRDQANPDPFFQRQQFGFALGGPICRDRVFYFGNWERNDQRAVAATTLLTPDFAHLSRITSNPLDRHALQRTARRENQQCAYGIRPPFSRCQPSVWTGSGDRRRIAKRLSFELEPRRDQGGSESGRPYERPSPDAGQRSPLVFLHRQLAAAGGAGEEDCPACLGLRRRRSTLHRPVC